MSDYYKEVIFKIKKLIEDDSLNEAKTILNEELSMPYIPIKYEEELNSLNQTVNSLLKLKTEGKEVTLAQIENYLKGDGKQQLQAVAVLFERNLRSHTALIREYLDSSPNMEAASLLIDAMIEQQITDEFKYKKDDVEYNFIPSCLTNPYESSGFLKADELLREWISNDNPSMYELSLQMLIHESYLYLPLSYEEDEGESLAVSITKKITELFNETDMFDEIVRKYSLTNIKTLEIKS